MSVAGEGSNGKQHLSVWQVSVDFTVLIDAHCKVCFNVAMACFKPSLASYQHDAPQDAGMTRFRLQILCDHLETRYHDQTLIPAMSAASIEGADLLVQVVRLLENSKKGAKRFWSERQAGKPGIWEYMD